MKHIYTIVLFSLISFVANAQTGVINLNQQPIEEIQQLMDASTNTLYINGNTYSKAYDNSQINVIRCNALSDLQIIDQNNLIPNKEVVQIIFVLNVLEPDALIDLSDYTQLKYLIYTAYNSINDQEVSQAMHAITTTAQTVKGYYQIQDN